ncbi:MAG: DUF63 family protein [Candidatus ainarchaeum sp.]|jgi:uncharacterized membrane protein|nr:DUF63 family protein [Candidatus ainarchaeum sp.]MDD4221478.1 DUF63 family protein [Candidatus ainarchaeum sp.]MDD4663008.1 DUF63 family protein [Candidatus ainarchaeum sp.]
MDVTSVFKIINLFNRYNLLEKGYTIFNTVLFSVIGIVVYFFVVYPYLLWRKVKIDFEFIKSVLLFVGIGSIVRLFSQDYLTISKLINVSSNPLSFNFYFQFPQLFILLALSFLIFFEVSLELSKRYNYSYSKILQTIGLVIFIPFLLYVLINIKYLFFFIAIIVFTFLILFLLIKLFKIFKLKILNSKINRLVLLSQILDGVATFFAISFFKDIFTEQHVVSFFILSINPILFVIIKIIISLLLIFLIDKFVTNSSENNYYKLFIIIIGLITGLRDLFTIALLVF